MTEKDNVQLIIESLPEHCRMAVTSNIERISKYEGDVMKFKEYLDYLTLIRVIPHNHGDILFKYAMSLIE